MEWEYTRTWRRHWLDLSGDYRNSHYEWTIKPVVEGYGFIHKLKDGYDLFKWGKKVKHGKSVKELKQYVNEKVEKIIGRKIY